MATKKYFKIAFDMTVSEEMVEKWCDAKGYNMQMPAPPMPAGAEPAKKETKAQFFQRTVKQDLLNISIAPIQQAIYMQSNQVTQKSISDLRVAAEEAMVLEIEEFEEKASESV